VSTEPDTSPTSSGAELEGAWYMGDFQKNEDFSFSENNLNIK
jgi:hypothetical protein